MPIKYLAILSLLISLLPACSTTIGSYSKRTIKEEFIVVQKQGETSEEFFLCSNSDDCHITPKNRFSSSDLFSVGDVLESEKADRLLNPIYTDKDINNFLSGKPVKVFFAFDSAVIDVQATDNLKRITDALKANKINKKLVLLSGTDAFGTRERNTVLAGDRAMAVKEIFIENGVFFQDVHIDRNVLCCSDLKRSIKLITAWRKFRSVTIALGDKSDFIKP